MLFGVALGFAIGVAAGWLGAPLAGKELRAKAASSGGRRSLADSLKRRDQTLASARVASVGARRQAETTAQSVADSVGEAASSARATAEDLRHSAAAATSRALQQPRTLIERLRDRLDEARSAAQDGYDEGVADAERLYGEVRRGRDLE